MVELGFGRAIRITTMQSMFGAVCDGARVGDEGQLEDERDGKVYWVGKLKDGNCWMTQNLDLDLYDSKTNTARKLTSTDSDIPNDLTSISGSSGLWTGSTSNYNTVRYYDPGEYVYTNPTISLSGDCGALDSPACADAGWQLMEGASTGGVVSEITHYLAGNYYSWGAATAGQAATFTSSATYPAEATQSICPKGWRLPENQVSTAGTAVVKSYRNLLDNYGWVWNQGSDPNKTSSSLTGTKDGITYDIRTVPLYFLYGGLVGNSSLNVAGSQGFYWSSTANKASSAYALYFSSGVNSSSDNSRYAGFSVRCVAR